MRSPSTSTSTTSNGPPGPKSCASTRAVSAGTPVPPIELAVMRLGILRRLQTRNDLVDQVGDLACTLDEHVQVATSRIQHVLPTLERKFMQPHAGDAFE